MARDELANEDFSQVISLHSENGKPAYYVAVGYAKRLDVKNTCQWLQQAFALSPDLKQEAPNDPNFVFLHENKAFTELLAGLS